MDIDSVVSFLQSKKALRIWNPFSFVLYPLVLLGLYYFVKLCIWRKETSKHIPGLRLRFFDVSGHISNLKRDRESLSVYPITVYILETVAAHAKLFQDKSAFCFWTSYSPFVVATKADAVAELIGGTKLMDKSWMYSFLHPWLGTGLLTSNGSKWKTRRKLLTPAFHFDILRDFLPVINEQSQILVEKLHKEANKPWTDIVKPVTLCSLDIICETILGESVDAQLNSESEYVKAVHNIAKIVMERAAKPYLWIDAIFYVSPLGRQFKAALAVLHAFTRKVIAKRKRRMLEEGMDGRKKERRRMPLMDILLEHLIRTRDLSEEDIREEVDTFVFEGHDTTSMGISWALYLVGLDKDVQNKLHDEIDQIFEDDTERPVTTHDLKELKYLDCVLKESQRLYPSVPLFVREAKEAITISGYPVPKGSSCVVFTYALHRDKDVFPNPEKFDPDRFLPEISASRDPYAYVPFSAGPRNCIGQRYALLEEKVVIANILRNFRWKSLVPRDKVQPSVEFVLRSADPLKIKITSRCSPFIS